MKSRPRLRAYVDGFNLYYGAMKQRPAAKWLDVVGWIQQMVPDHDLLSVEYCTAKPVSRDDPQAIDRQDRYFKALQSLRPEVRFHYGQFREREKWARRAVGPVSCSCCMPSSLVNMEACFCCTNSTVKIIKTEEKGSDVNLAVLLVRDSLLRETDTALIISGDSDLQMSIDIARTSGVQVIVADPRNAGVLKADGKRTVKEKALLENQLPDQVVDGAGRVYRRNRSWK